MPAGRWLQGMVMADQDRKSPEPGIEDWAGIRGERWLSDVDRFEAMLAPIGDAVLARAGFAPGEHVVDIGCGGGWTTRAIAVAVGPGGSATGLDVSPVLVAEARRRAAAAGIANAEFLLGDAAVTTPPAAPFDRLFSRFGVMFFADPIAAFRNLGRMLKPGGRLDMAVWAHPRDNPWMMEMRGVVARHVDVPQADPRAPGPFQMADPDFLAEILEGGGFAAPEMVLHKPMLALGGPGSSPASAVDFALRAFSIAELLDGAPPELLATVKRELEDVYRANEGPGGVTMPASIWLVSARRD